MLLNPAAAASAVMQWMQCPELEGGQFLPEHLQIAAYLGQHTVRPVTRNEYIKSDVAMDAYWKEWTNLEGKGVYRKETLIEWHIVRKEALNRNKDVHLAFLFGFMVRKGVGYLDGDPRKKFKYRVVLRGNNIKDQSFEVALFQEMATTPTTLQASRFCDLLGFLEGSCTQGRDVEQAYLLAKMKGPATYIILPQEVWAKRYVEDA